jgi:hypothetical protein
MTVTDIEIAELGTEPLTQAERDAISAYCQRITGVPDCFDLVPEDSLGVLADEFTHAETPDLIRSWFRMLGDWRDAITVLAEDLAEAAGNAVPSTAFPLVMSEAATRYVGHELLEWHQALEGWRWGTIEFFLGKDEHGYRFDHFAPRPEGWRLADGSYWING